MATSFANTFAPTSTSRPQGGFSLDQINRTVSPYGITNNPVQGPQLPPARTFLDQPITTPVPATKTPTNPVSAPAVTPFTPTPTPQTDLFYNGTHYTDQAQYQNAVVKDVNDTHTKTINDINTAYKQGLISFDQQQKLIDQNRSSLKTQTDQALQALDTSNTAAKDSQMAHFASADANAVSSRQGELAQQTQEQYNQSLKNTNDQASQGNQAIDTSQQNLQLARGNYDTQYQNNLQGADKAQIQGTDAVNNAGLSFQNQIAQVNAANQNGLAAYNTQVQNANAAAANANAPTTTQFDPQALTANLAQYVISAASIAPKGNTLEQTVSQSLTNAANTLKQQGIDPNSGPGADILNYLQGQFLDTKSQLYANLNSKTPLNYQAPTGQ